MPILDSHIPYKVLLVTFVLSLQDFATPSLELSEEEVFAKDDGNREEGDEDVVQRNRQHLLVMKRKWESRYVM